MLTTINYTSVALFSWDESNGGDKEETREASLSSWVLFASTWKAEKEERGGGDGQLEAISDI